MSSFGTFRANRAQPAARIEDEDDDEYEDDYAKRAVPAHLAYLGSLSAQSWWGEAPGRPTHACEE